MNIGELMPPYVWPLADILIGVFMFFIFKEEVKAIRNWARRQHKRIDSGQYCSEDTGRVIVKLWDLATQQASALQVAVALWLFALFGLLIFSGTIMPLEPDQIPDTTFEWTIAWIGFISLSVGPWFFGFYMLWSGRAIRVVMWNGILNLKPFWRRVFIRWDEVKNVYVTYSEAGTPYFYLDTKHGSIILGLEDKNIDKFAEVITTNVPRDKWDRVDEYLQFAKEWNVADHTDKE
jgi:hypothetical protein